MMINTSQFNLTQYPTDITEFVTDAIMQLEEHSSQYLTDLKQYPAFVDSFILVWIASNFVLKHCLQDMAIVKDLFQSEDIISSYSMDTYQQKLDRLLQTATSEAEFNLQLRKIRQREMLRIAWRDIASWCCVDDTLQDLTHLADASLQTTYQFHYKQLSEIFGIPMDESQEAQHLLILALGKLGARELNFSSDIDLIFAFTSHGETKGGRLTVENEKFFTRLAQALIKSLNETTVDGFVFRVDMRLRPYGSTGALVMSLSAMEAYYQEQGRDWERYALLKARVVNQSCFPKASERVSEMLKRFVYRRYVDFSVITALRDLKKLLESDAKKKSVDQDIKRAAGGIREIEFIVQSIQLVRGGKEPFLQTTSFLQALNRFEQGNCLSNSLIQELKRAWYFLRKTENLIQMANDRQTQRLPEEDFSRCRLAIAAGFENWGFFHAELKKQMRLVKQHFDAMVRDRAVSNKENQPEEQMVTQCQYLWLKIDEDTERLQILEKIGFSKSAKEVLVVLKNMQVSMMNLNLNSIAKKRLDALMPLLLIEIIPIQNPANVLERICILLNSVIRRSAYLSLLLENNSALTLLVRIFSASSFVAKEISHYPILLDELLSLEWVYSNSEDCADDLAKRLLLIADNDPEERFTCVCQFKKARVLRVMVNDLLESPSIWNICHDLSSIALTVLTQVRAIAMDQMIKKYGVLSHLIEENFDFGIVAYGKLGSHELGYSSDLDLVFLFDTMISSFETNQGTISAHEFAVKIAQRIVHLLSIQTSSGLLYALDLRLRPSGSVGSLVTSLEAFGDYQLNKAWVWEHQALVKACAVDGSHQFCLKFNQIRVKILCQQREKANLLQEIQAMRQKMLDNLGGEKREFDLKSMPGGITDIEFMVQCGVLLLAVQHPSLVSVKQTVHLINKLTNLGFFIDTEGELLKRALEHYYVHLQRASLQGGKINSEITEFANAISGVKRVWERVFS